MGAPTVEIDVIICTHNRAADLDRVLALLKRQRCSDAVRWQVLVVDNASTDATADVVEACRAKGALPALRRVFEPEPGLTAARRRGVRETTAPWVAFVDDDNLIQAEWLEAVASAIRAHPDAGGVGGRVVLDWEAPPPGLLKDFGFCFAEQDAGEADCAVESLVGAGMVLRRAALVESGWLDRPLLADRVGNRLISGSDVEIAQRVRAAGYSLWYTPAAVLHHRIPASRMSRRYLFRVNLGLGASEALVSALTWPGDWPSWRRMAAARRRDWYVRSRRGLVDALRHRQGLVRATAWACFGLGFARGVRHCEALAPAERAALLGAAAPRAAVSAGVA